MIPFCEKHKDRIRKQLKRKLTNTYTFSFFEKTDDIPASDWDLVQNKNDFFLCLPYLKLMEGLHQPSITHRFVIVYRAEKPVWIALFQVIDFTADVFGDLVEGQLTEIKSSRLKLFDKYVDKYRDQVIMRLVTCGNNFVSGAHGFACVPEINRLEAFFLVDKITTLVSKAEKLRGAISATLLKDFYIPDLPVEKILEKNSFIKCAVEPNMFVEIPPMVSTLNEYIALFSKKYRNRAKNIFKSGAAIRKKDLTAEEVEKHKHQIFNLYENVFTKAKFKLVKLAPDYFSEMKKQFADHFFVTGYFLEDSLVAFDSGHFLNKETVEAHCIGIDYELNKTYELYQNILYHYIEVCILHHQKRLNLGRTASEIKSTVGAKAHDLVCFIKPQNTVSKVILNPFITFLQPSDWTPRNPFKEEDPEREK